MSLSKRIWKIMSSNPSVSGLEVTDNSLRFVLLKNAAISLSASVNLPPGIVEDGLVRDRQQFIAALATLRNQIPKKNIINIILVIPATHVYTQVFSLPLLPEDKIAEAARLNLETISPINSKNAFFDWQYAGDPAGKDGKLELIGAFIQRNYIDELSYCVEQAGFVIVAIEPLPLSLARLINFTYPTVLDSPRLVLHLSSAGLDFFILRSGALYFEYYLSFREIQERLGVSLIKLADLKKIVIFEVNRLLNFYIARESQAIEELVVSSVIDIGDLLSDLSASFKLKITPLLLSNYPDLISIWYPVFGAALRGEIPRSKDTFISLASAGTEERFKEERAMSFIRFWRLITLSIISSLTVVSLVLYLFGLRQEKALTAKLAATPTLFSSADFTALSAAADSFNALIAKAEMAEKNTNTPSRFINTLSGLALGIDILGLDFDPNSGDFSITGDSDSEKLVIDFKNTLLKDSRFDSIILPVTAIRLDSSGSARFTLRGRVKSSDFPPLSIFPASSTSSAPTQP